MSDRTFNDWWEKEIKPAECGDTREIARGIAQQAWATATMEAGRPKRYNGWTNYETWNVALWIGNDEPSYRFWTERAEVAWKEAEADNTFSREEHAAYELSQEMQQEIAQEMAPDLGASMYSDLLSAALSEVNWLEIAEHYIADLDKTEEPEEAEAD